MQKWEYTTRQVNPRCIDEFLEEYGEKGWELVTALHHNEWIMLIFKRPVTQ